MWGKGTHTRIGSGRSFLVPLREAHMCILLAILHPAVPGLEVTSVTQGMSTQEPRAPQLWWVKELPILRNRVNSGPGEMGSPPAIVIDELGRTRKELSKSPQLQEMTPLAFMEHSIDWNELLRISQQSHVIAL